MIDALLSPEIPLPLPVSPANLAKPKVIDLFSGVGGLSLGAARAGFHVALAVELEAKAIATHALNFPASNHAQVDVRLAAGADLLCRAGLIDQQLDGLIGGPPCQGFSRIGRRNLNDARNTLFANFFRLAREMKPKFFVAENVPGILDDIYEDIRRAALDEVREEYLLLEPITLKASDYGAATGRERVFFIGYRKDDVHVIEAESFVSARTQSPVTVSHALSGLTARVPATWSREELSWRTVDPLPNTGFLVKAGGDVPYDVGNEWALILHREQRLVSGFLGTRHTEKVRNRFRRLRPGETDSISRCVRLDPDGLCPTLRAGTGPDRGSFQALRPVHPFSPRVITPREAARLQGFPDWFLFHPTKWHSFRQIGNSVSPLLAESVLGVIRTKLK